MKNLVLYDGQCGLCNRAVMWLLKIDRRRVLTFAPLQGETAKQFHLPSFPQSDETIVYISESLSENQRIFFRSDALLQILRAIGGLWKLATFLGIIPGKLRDALYQYVARNRYRWFGNYETCLEPPENFKERFLT